MKIKEVEDLVGITKANIRYYEKEGLLNPKRNEENNYREYTLEDVRSLELTPNQFNRNIAVMFTADMRIHLALFHASALILTPFVISLYGFVQMLLNSSEMPVQTMGRMQMLVFWAMLLVYVGCFFCLAQKWGAYLKDIHIAALSAAYTAVMTALFGLVWGKWLFAAAAFFAFTLYIGTVWKDAFAVEKISTVTMQSAPGAESSISAEHSFHFPYHCKITDYQYDSGPCPRHDFRIEDTVFPD